MTKPTLLPDPTCWHLQLLDGSSTANTAVVTTTSEEAECPLCHRYSSRIHSRYVREVADLRLYGLRGSLGAACAPLFLFQRGVRTPDLHGTAADSGGSLRPAHDATHRCFYPHERQGQRLDEWLKQVEEQGVAELQRFAQGLQRDYDAVKAGLTLPWSQGPVEGHVHRLKLIKRQA
jgi:Transposase